MMNSTSYYVLDVPAANSVAEEMAGTEFQLAKGFKTGEAPSCPRCGKFIGMRPWLPPFRVRIVAWGAEFGDIAFKSVGDDLLVSPRFREHWEREGLVGLSGFDPVEIEKVNRRGSVIGDPPAYLRANVVRSMAKVDYAASGFEWLSGPPTCTVCLVGDGGKRRNGIVIDPASWSGEDIFIARSAAEFIVSERFRDFCNKFAIKNALLVPAETCAQDHYPWQLGSKSGIAASDRGG